MPQSLPGIPNALLWSLSLSTVSAEEGRVDGNGWADVGDEADLSKFGSGADGSCVRVRITGPNAIAQRTVAFGIE